MRQTVEVADKSVSTDDDLGDKKILDVARLEAVLAALVETKVVAIRNDVDGSLKGRSSPIAILANTIANRRRLQSAASTGSPQPNRRDDDPESGLPALHDECERRELVRHADRTKKRGRHKDKCKEDHQEIECCDDQMCEPPARCWHEMEPCLPPSSPSRHGHDSCSVVSECVVVLERERACTRTRTRARRKRRRKRRARALLVESMEERVKVIDPDELPQRARWTIMVTACLLLFLCLLLVGVTLRMAPLIDDMVRQENERIMHESMNIGIANLTQPIAVQRTGT